MWTPLSTELPYLSFYKTVIQHLKCFQLSDIAVHSFLSVCQTIMFPSKRQFHLHSLNVYIIWKILWMLRKAAGAIFSATDFGPFVLFAEQVLEDFVGSCFYPSMQTHTHTLFSVFVVCKGTQRSFLIAFVLFFLLRALKIFNSSSNMNSACLWKLMLSFPRGWLWPCSLPNQFYSSIMEVINEQVRAEHLSPVCRCEAQLWGQ